MGKLFDTMAVIAQKTVEFPDRCAALAVPALVSKLGDIKLKSNACACLHAFAEAWSVNNVSLMVCKEAEAVTNPKVKSLFFMWFRKSHARSCCCLFLSFSHSPSFLFFMHPHPHPATCCFHRHACADTLKYT